MEKVGELWFTEKPRGGSGFSMRIDEVLFHGKSDFQSAMVFRNSEYGNVMLLDDSIMITDRDEFVYHEMLAHVPLMSHPSPKKVLVIGAGDGGTVREICRHKRVEKVDWVEIDKLVIELGERYFPAVSAANKDPRVNIMVQDGIEYVKNTKEKYDVILVDSTDPVGPGVVLFSEEFYGSCKRLLNEGGILVPQTESPFFHQDIISHIYATLRKVFAVVMPYTVTVVTYPSGIWSFGYATAGRRPDDYFADEEYSRFSDKLKYYTRDIQRGAFCVPAYVKRLTGAA
ncbi:MAG: polyamine aminopropyltransferase [Deltaproteobacteria bacterium]|nr:polyamine aminopropyltransferase [Deltaproteobacteria bacterium]